MRALGVELDSVCQEAHIHQFTTMVNLIDSTSQPDGATLLAPPSGTAFAIRPIPIGGIVYEWKLGDSILASAADTSIVIRNTDLYAAGRTTSAPLQVTATLPTILMRQFTAQRTV